MVFIVRGKLVSVGEDGIRVPLGEGDVCGEELLTWYLGHSSISTDGRKIRLPGQRLVSNRTVRCLTNVEAFSLSAAELEEVTTLFTRFLRSPRVQGALRFFVSSTLFCCGGFIYKTKVERQRGIDALPGMKILSACLETAYANHLLRNKRAISLQNYAQFHMWQFRQDLFISWRKNLHESDFLRNISRENWIWLDNVWLVNKDRFFSNVWNVSSNIQYN